MLLGSKNIWKLIARVRANLYMDAHDDVKYSSLGRHLDYSQHFSITKQTSVNMFICVSLCTCDKTSVR